MILGFSGTFSAGKDVLADHLEKKFGLMHISTGDILREIAQQQRGSIERPILYEVGNELRHKYGGGILAERAIDRYHSSIRTYAGVVITGIRSLAEAQRVKSFGGQLVFIDSPIEVRYKRMLERQRDSEVKLTLDEFRISEEKEMNSGISDADFNIKQIGEMADIRIENADTEEDFFANAEKALSLA